MPNRKHTLLNLLDKNPQIHLAYFVPDAKSCILHVHTASALRAQTIAIPDDLKALPCQIHVEPQAAILRCPLPTTHALNVNQQCQNEPIELGTQIQPAGKQWVGTAGAPVHWLDDNGAERYGILSNWHVMADGANGVGHAQHQPDFLHPPAASLADWVPVSGSQTNFFDAALADSLVNGQHTTATSILGIGKLNPEPAEAVVGMDVIKSGRTSGLTRGRITATGAAAKVGYGDFVATFAEQIVITHGSAPFSAPGDSGSLVVSNDQHRPVGLLFAGGGGTTIANPLPALQAAFDLDFLY